MIQTDQQRYIKIMMIMRYLICLLKRSSILSCSNPFLNYIKLLEPIPKLHQVPQNDNDVVSEVTGVVQGREIVEQHPANFEETRALYDSLYQNLATEV
uniref:Uncharacterized protein n=1 Tax=Tanacetum cinerariifolium TaxID=118510 RepID=A0A699STX4_TANCI|nr:hypothetical protein [Tanacetum cinerariifolium]